MAAALVPLLPSEIWAHILRQGQDERTQLRAWVAWAHATLLQLVVVWFRTGGQRNNRWLGKLVGKNGGISTANTANMMSRFAPWCKAFLSPGEENEPLHYSGMSAVPAAFIDVYEHMLYMMTYLGFHNVIERLQHHLRLLARCVHPDSGTPKYIPGPPDSDDEDDDVGGGCARAGAAAAAATETICGAGRLGRSGASHKQRINNFD